MATTQSSLTIKCMYIISLDPRPPLRDEGLVSTFSVCAKITQKPGNRILTDIFRKLHCKLFV